MLIFTDGSGKTGKYVYVIPEKKIVRLFQKRGLTNNEAEYNAVIMALKENKDNDIRIQSDSQLIVNQLNKNYKIKEPRLRKLAEKVWELCKGRNVHFYWIRRESNKAGFILG